MSNDSAMLSDDDQPLVAKSATNGSNQATNSNGNGHVNNAHDESSLSEDDEDDTPLSQTTRTSTRSPGVRGPSALKRKKAIHGESSSSSEDGTPLASSPAKHARSAAVAMPGAVSATTLPTSGSKPKTNGKNKSKKDDDDETPKKNGNSKRPPRKKVKVEEEDVSDDDDDTPLVSASKKPTAPKRKRKAKAESPPSSDDDEKPLIKKRAAVGKKAKKEAEEKDQESSSSEAPLPVKAKRKSAKAKKDDDEASSPKKGKGKKKKDDDEEQEQVFRWWEQQDADGDGSIKWQTLEHNGVIFPPPYEPLPSNVKMKYNGKLVNLPAAAEEVAGFYAAMIETDHARDATFNKNFFEDWTHLMKQHPPLDGTKITDFTLCDFRPMFEHFESEKAKRKTLTAAEKKDLKKAKDDLELPYTTCLLDGRKEKVGNFRVEPPGLFRGRGDHPKKGALKHRVRPEDITINIGKGAPVPVPNMPGKWKAVQHDQTVTWLANWTENVNNNHKYVFLAAGSSLKGQSDMMKFEKARELKKHVDRIRQNYNADLKSKVMADRQRATAMYFIDKLALRAGNEKGEDEADTVGCCSLRCEHVTLEAPNFIIFDFLGKDSIRYYNRVPVEAQVFKNIRIFKEGKDDDDNLFDRVNTSLLNKHLASEMKGLTAKVFRTYNASITFQRLLDEGTDEKKTLQEKLNAYNHANRLVAILCNHQRSAPKTHDQSMEKMKYKLRSFKYERMKLRHALFRIDSTFKTQRKYKEDESDIDDEWIASHEDQLKEKEIEKAEKKFAKDNEKLVEEGKKPHNDSVLRERLEVIEAEFARLEKERGTGRSSLKKDRPTEKIEEAIEKLDEKMKAFKLQIDDRDAGKEVALGTSKINYLDPRITAAWCQIHDVPIEKIFSKTLITKFPWAMEVEQDWKF